MVYSSPRSVWTMRCARCGTVSAEGSRFCEGCGGKLGEPTESISAPAAAPASPSTPSAAVVTPRAPSGAAKAVGLALALILLGGGLGYLGFQYWMARRSVQAPTEQAAMPQIPTATPEVVTPPAEIPTAVENPPPAAVPQATAPAEAAPVETPARAPAKPAPKAATAVRPVSPHGGLNPIPTNPLTPAPQTAPPPPPPQEPRPLDLPAPAKPAERPKQEQVTIRPPVPPPPPAEPPKPAYSGPSTGVVVWSGKLEKGESVVIEGGNASAGTLNGKLPGVPVSVNLDVREFALAEAPSPSNNWSKLVIRSRNRRHTVVTIEWKVLN